MKKAYLLLLVSLILSLLVSCSSDYPPVESTESEARTVMVMTIDGTEYDVKYELYRALFLTLRENVDNGDVSVWTGENKGEYIEKIDTMIKKRVAEIYGTLHVAGKIGIDVYSDDFNAQITDYITASVEGGGIGDIYLEGFDGDYDKYLASLKEMNLNYSVQTLMIRYALASSAIESYYIGGADEYGKIQYTESVINEFYYSDECVRVLRVFLDGKIWTRDSADKKSEAISKLSNSEEVAIYMINLTSSGGPDVKNGNVIAKYNLDALYYEDVTNAAFALGMNETSEAITVNSATESGYTILYRTDKNEEHFKACYDEIATTYVQNEIGRILYEAASALLDSCEYTDVLNQLDRATISMD